MEVCRFGIKEQFRSILTYLLIDHVITLKENNEDNEAFEQIDMVPDPELAEHDGKVHVVKMNNIGLADAALFKVSIKLTCCCSGLKFLQTEDSEKKNLAVQRGRHFVVLTVG